MRLFVQLVCIAIFPVFVGCSETGEGFKEPISMDKVPPEILKVAQDKYPDLVFDVAFTETEDGVAVYELKGKAKSGKMREVEVTADGKILE